MGERRRNTVERRRRRRGRREKRRATTHGKPATLYPVVSHPFTSCFSPRRLPPKPLAVLFKSVNEFGNQRVSISIGRRFFTAPSVHRDIAGDNEGGDREKSRDRGTRDILGVTRGFRRDASDEAKSGISDRSRFATQRPRNCFLVALERYVGFPRSLPTFIWLPSKADEAKQQNFPNGRDNIELTMEWKRCPNGSSRRRERNRINKYLRNIFEIKKIE